MQEATTTAQRTVRQYLESLAHAGITHLPYRRPLPSDSLISNADPVIASEESTSVENSTDSTSTADSGQQLCALAKQVAECTRCEELASARTQTVFGVGNPNAQIMFIGEAPGADEDRLGEPFVGKAGKLLDQIIEASKLVREDLYICNILRCRPPGNRNPSTQEAENCREYLDGQIRIVDPDYIVCWGGVAAQNLLQTKESIGRLRGRFMKYGRAKVVCTYHPSYLLRSPGQKKHVWEDMKFLMRDLGVELDSK